MCFTNRVKENVFHKWRLEDVKKSIDSENVFKQWRDWRRSNEFTEIVFNKTKKYKFKNYKLWIFIQ